MQSSLTPTQCPSIQTRFPVITSSFRFKMLVRGCDNVGGSDDDDNDDVGHGNIGFHGL